MLRIVDKETKIFIRDDLYFNEETEEGLDVEPAQGLYKPLWDGEKWMEGATPEEIDKIKNVPQEPTELELIKLKNAELEEKQKVIEEMMLSMAMGGMM